MKLIVLVILVVVLVSCDNRVTWNQVDNYSDIYLHTVCLELCQLIICLKLIIDFDLLGEIISAGRVERS